MVRRVFFSFHYDRDSWRVNPVRCSWVTKDRQTAGFWDAADWENVKRRGDAAIKAWIEDQLSGTSVTVVLIGAETAHRKYVLHEIRRSHELGKAMLGVRIHGIRNERREVDLPGADPFDMWTTTGRWGQKEPLSRLYRTYDWNLDNGYSNFARWIEEAYISRGLQRLSQL